MSGILGIVNVIDRKASIQVDYDIPEKDLCMLVILVARFHVVANLGEWVDYDIYVGQYLKKPMYIIRNSYKEIYFRVDVETKEIYWKNGKKSRANLLDSDYTFKDGVLYNIYDPKVSFIEQENVLKKWDKYGLVADYEAMEEKVEDAQEEEEEEILVTGDSPYYHGELVILDEPEEGCVYEAQGPRPTMEDAHVSAKIGDSIQIYGVFDGHGGRRVADRVAEELPLHIKDELEHVDIEDEGNVKFAIEAAFGVLDHNLFNTFMDDDGSTAIVAVLIGDKIYLANLGDSRGVIYNYETGKIVLDTKDHKPDDEKEVKRIEKAGSFVFRKRVGGVLAVSRAFGDRSLKKIGDEYGSGDAPVSPKPDVYVFDRKKGRTYNIVLACDGLWDVMDLDGFEDYMTESGIDSNNICQELVELALDRGSRDNVTVMSIDLLDAEKKAF